MIKKKPKVRVRREFRENLFTLFDYLWRDEKRHYVEWRGKDHIYLVMRKLAKEIDFKPTFDW